MYYVRSMINMYIIIQFHTQFLSMLPRKSLNLSDAISVLWIKWSTRQLLLSMKMINRVNNFYENCLSLTKNSCLFFVDQREKNMNFNKFALLNISIWCLFCNTLIWCYTTHNIQYKNSLIHIQSKNYCYN